LMNHEHPEGGKFAEAALERGRLALEHIFPDDKLVRLLINNLEKTLALESARRGEPSSTPVQPLPHASESEYDCPADAGEELEEIDLAGSMMNQNSASFHQRSPNQSSDETSRDLRESKEDKWPTIRNLPV
jgi:hypothetical protein